MSRIAVLVNPAAGGGRAAGVWDDLRRSESLAGARVIRAADPGAAREELSAALESGIERLVVAGGDGSMHLATNVILELGRGRDVEMGLVPLGTGSDLGRSLGTPRDAKAALDAILHAQAKPMDAFELVTADGRRRFVVNVASAGISGVVDEAVNAVPNRGRLSYLAASVRALLRYRPTRCHVRVDGESWYDGPLLLLAIANGACFGRGMRIAPQARLDDGEADLVLIGDVPMWQLLARFPQLYRGTHLDSGYVRWRRGRVVEIEPRAPLPPFDLDGEVVASDACRITVLPGALRILA